MNSTSELEKLSDARFTEILTWLSEGGATFPNGLYFVNSEKSGRGLYSSDPILKNSKVIVIPAQFLITLQMALDSDIGQELSDLRNDLNSPDSSMLSMFMLVDMKNFDSFYQPYYWTLPTDYPFSPLYWTPEQRIRLLSGSQILQQIDEWEEDAVEDFNFICKAVPDMISVYHITFKEFKWARMTVGSRNFTITVNGVPMMCMVPLVDMINHSRPRQTRWKFVKSSNEFEVLAVKSILPGQEITDSYGEKCNSRLLLTYGFALSDNSDGDQTDSFNACAIFLPLSKDDPLYRIKCNLLGGEDLFEENNSFDFNLSNRYIKCLLNSSYYSHNTLNTFSRARIISIAHIDEIPNKSNALGLLNQENELRSLELIKYSIQNTLRKYVACNQTTEQRSSRANTVDSINFDNAQILIQGEMQICKCWYETIENAVLLLSRTESKNDSATLNIVNENNSRNSYLREVIIPCLCHG